VIRLSNADARRLVQLLDAAEQIDREHAVVQSYRRDACRFLREKILADYHDRRWSSAVDLAASLADAGGTILVKVEEAHTAA
jgi:hypothetical protein